MNDDNNLLNSFIYLFFFFDFLTWLLWPLVIILLVTIIYKYTNMGKGLKKIIF